MALIRFKRLLQELFYSFCDRAGYAPEQPYPQAVELDLVLSLNAGADNTVNFLLRQPGTGIFSLGTNPLLCEAVCAGAEICLEHAECACTIEARENPAIVTGDSYVYRFRVHNIVHCTA